MKRTGIFLTGIVLGVCVVVWMQASSQIMFLSVPKVRAQGALTPAATPTAWPTTTGGLHRCSSLPVQMVATQPAGTVQQRQYIAQAGHTDVIDHQTGQVTARIPVAGELSFNYCNHRILIAAGKQGIFMVDEAELQIIGHLPYLLDTGSPSPVIDTNVYAVGVVSNSITDDYQIKVRGPHYAHGGYWQADDIVFFDSVSLTMNGSYFTDYSGSHFTSGTAAGFDPANAIYDPRTDLFYTTATCCGDVPTATVSAWDTHWQFVRSFLGLGGTGQPLHLEGQRLYVGHQDRWLFALDTATFQIVGTYPCCAVPTTESPYVFSDLTPGVKPQGLFRSVALSPAYDQDRIVFLVTTDGLYRSNDSAERWARVLANPHMGRVWLSPTYATDRTLFVSLTAPDPSENEGLVRSMDGGDTWQPMSAGLAGLIVGDFRYSQDYAQDHRVWVLVNDALHSSAFMPTLWMISPGSTQIWQATDPSAMPAISTPTPPDSGFCPGEPPFAYLQQAVKADGSDTWFGVAYDADGANGYHLLRTRPSGCWREVTTLTLGEISPPFIAVSPNYGIDHTLFVISEQQEPTGIFYRSTDGGATWKRLLP